MMMKIFKDYIKPATSTGLYEMNLNPITLAFPGDLEEKFLDDYYKNSMILIRISLLAGIFLYGFFSILDAQLVPEVKEKLWFIRFTIVLPSFLVVILLSYFPRLTKYFQALVTITMIIASYAIIIMISIIPPPENYSYYAGLILVFMWGYAFTRVRFIWATLAGWLIVVFYEIIAVWFSNMSFSILINNNFFFISANVIGMFVCYSIEYYARTNYYVTFLLEEEQEKIHAANLELEKIAEKRTAQLLETNKDLRREIEERQRSEKEKKELESLLLHAQKMEALGTLAGGIAHDFNNLLMGIQGNTSLVLSNMKPDDPNYKKIETAEKYIKKSAEFTKQILGFARGGKYEVKKTDLNELIQKNSLLFGRTKKEMPIYTNFQEDIWSVKVDQGQIEQVLLNLYLNATQAMPNGGNLYIRTENVTLNKKYMEPYKLEPGDYVKTSVTDTGIGMDKTTLQKVFDPFFTTKKLDRGTGLGLASAYGIIKNHNGFFEVSSEKNKGTTFNFYIPASEKKVMQKNTKPQEIQKGNETILLVDDEDMVIDATSEMLETLGYSVNVARSGEEAILFCRKNNDKIDLVILDIVMPAMNGVEAYGILKKINPQIKVLLSSGYSVNESVTKMLDNGCQGFIQKPFNLTQLSQKVREVLDKH
jgi:signal transduction histidine kinase/ActR/RegA family two-component response regulator